MNILFGKTVTGKTISYFRPDGDYTDTTKAEAALVVAATDGGTSVASYAITSYDAVLALEVAPADFNTRIQVAQKQDVPEGGVIVPPEGIILADIPNDGYVVYVV
jgi:hypothetical protein